IVMSAGPTQPLQLNTTPVSFQEVRHVINNRCVACHSSHPTDEVFKIAPNGVMFDRPETIHAMADRIKFRAVVSKTMPLVNKTGITEEEREILGRWVDQGAKTQ
ncbi:MAG: urate hydroxylase PuuD, partial [Bdellovibrionota bacterium]